MQSQSASQAEQDKTIPKGSEVGAIGGHTDQIQIAGAQVIKKTHESEIKFYQDVNDEKASEELMNIKKYIPQFFGAINEDGDNKIKIENITHGMSQPNIMDIKIGTSTVTFNTRSKGEEGIIKRNKKDAEATSAQHGFNIIGYHFPGSEEKVQKPRMSYKLSVEKIAGLFIRNDVLKTDFVDQAITWISKLKNDIQSFPYEIRGASILICLDDSQCQVKLIDLASIEKMDEDYYD